MVKEQTIVLKLKVDTTDAIKSINNLTQKLRELRRLQDERGNLNV